MRISWTKGPVVMAVSTALIALQGAQAAVAQFVPYTANQNRGLTQQTPFQYGAQPQYNTVQHNAAQPQYTAMAFQGSGAREAMSQGAEAIGPGRVQASQPTQAAPMANYSPAPSPYTQAPAANCNCQAAPAPTYTQPAAAPMNYESYPVASGGCAPSSCNSYSTFSAGVGYGSGDCTGCGVGGGYLGARNCGRRWFGGFYGLYMQRASQTWKPLAFSTDQPVPYYPTTSDYVLNLENITETEHAGAEVRFGSTFGGRGLGGAGCGCGPRYGWEFAYWGLVEEDSVASFSDADITAGDRLYSNMDFRGLEYDPDGAGAATYRPLNDYVDYGPPTRPDVGDPIRLNSITVRTRFSAQNIELNLLRLPVLTGGGCVGGGCDSGYGACGCDSGSCGYGAGGCGGCSSGCATGCGLGRGRLGGRLGRGGYGYTGPRYQLTTLAGVRYLRLDEDFQADFDATNTVTLANIPTSYRSEADNHLVGFQLGCNGVYHLGCSGRWALNCSANAGIYGNRAEVNRTLNMPAAGVLRYVGGTNDPFTTASAEDDSIATIAELRFGASYQYSCNWRFFGGYRALGISGIALAFDQHPNDFSSPGQVAQYVNTDGSLFLHGLQGGVEFSY